MTQTEILESYGGWIRTVAASYAKGDPELTEEYAQEGMIALWKALEKEPNAPAVHLKMQVRKRLNNCYTRGVREGQPKRAHSTNTKTVAADSDSPVWEGLVADPSNPDLAYHHQEIADAVRGLSPAAQEYVYLRFWKGLDTKQLTEHFGYKPFALWSRPGSGAKAVLKERLAHLETVL